MLSSDEELYLYLIGAIVLIIPVLNWLKKDATLFWSPLTMVSLVFFYYTVIGPYFAIQNDTTYYRLLEHRPFFLIGWQISLAALLCIIIGFQFIKTPQIGVNSSTHDLDVNYAKIGRTLSIITMIGIVGLVGTGGLVNQFDVLNAAPGSSLLGGGGAFRNYLMHSINLLIGASCFYLVATMNKKSKVLWFVFIFLFAMAVFTRQGFRWRHVILGMSLLGTFYLMRGKKVNVFLFTGLAVVGIAFMGFVESTRTYGGGLRYDEGKAMSNEEYFDKGFGESAVFMTTALLVAKTTVGDEFIGFDPIIQAIVMPIPRVLWPEKPSGDYIRILVDLYSEEHALAGLGVAVLNYGEYYLMFGFMGVVIGCIVLGLLLKLVWRWFLLNRDNPLAIITYAVFFSYIYVILSRGYLPQVFYLFMFTVYPLFWIFRRQMKQLKLKASSLN